MACQHKSTDRLTQLIAMVASLRNPQTGCAWSRAQTWLTLAPYTVEEVYELVDALLAPKQDDTHIQQELADLLFHIIYYCQIAREQSNFEFADVLQHAIDKAEHRNPHVFNKEEVQHPVSREHIKFVERRQTQHGQTSWLDGVAKVSPALIRAQKIQHRAATAGFGWTKLDEVFDAIVQSLREIQEQLAIDKTNQERLLDECGDLLYSCVNACRHLALDAETALRQRTLKFEQRFRAMESMLSDNETELANLSREQQHALWQRAKVQVELQKKVTSEQIEDE